MRGEVVRQVEEPAQVLALRLVAVHAPSLRVALGGDVDARRDLGLGAAELVVIGLLRLDGAHSESAGAVACASRRSPISHGSVMPRSFMSAIRRPQRSRTKAIS